MDTLVTNERSAAAYWTLARRLLVGSALVIMLLHFFIYVYYSIALMRFPFDYDQGEGFELTDAVYLSEGKSPYRDNEVFPFYASNYPPVYRLVLTPFVWVFGAEYWYGRLISFIGTLTTAGAIGYGIYQAERRREIALLMGLAFLASNYIYHIGPLLRQHYFMVMFETLCVVTLAPALDDHASPKAGRRLWLGLLFLLLAGYTKQLAFVTAGAVFLWLFIRSPRRAVFYGIVFSIAGGVIFVFLNLITHGQWWTNVIAANVNQYIFSQFTGLLKQFTRLHWVILLLAGLLAVYELYFTRLSLYTIWFVIAMASTVGSGKWGAGNSYFATPLAGACILAGIFIARTLNGAWTFRQNYITRAISRFIPKQSGWIYPSLGLICLALMTVYGLTVIKLPTSGAVFEPISEFLGVRPKAGHRYPLYDAAGWTPGYATIGHLPSQEDVDNGWKIVERIQASPLPVMSEEAGFSLQAGREIITNPTQLKNLYENDLFDPTPLVQMIENQEFGLIIFRARFYPDPVLAAVDNAYHPTEVIPMNGFNYELWYPEPTWKMRREIRDFLEGTPAAPLTLPLPEGIPDLDQWLLDTMTRWAWLPELQLEAPQGDLCDRRAFVRRGLRAEVSLCNGKITVQPPSPAD